MQIILLYNSYSRQGKGINTTIAIKKILESKNLNYKEYKDTWPEKFDADDQLWLIGGDGTINYFVNKYGLIKNDIAFFAGGTGNDFHWQLYGKTSIETQVDKVLTSSSSPVDIGRCNDKYFVNMIGLGFDGAVLKGIDRVKWLGGHLAYLVAVVQNIFTYKESPLTIKTPTASIEKSTLLCIISNASRTGGGFMVSPNAKINDGQLNWISCSPMSIIERLLFLPEVEKGNHLANKKVEEQLITQMTITASEKVFYQLDGELMSDKVFIIEVVKSALNFIH